MENINKCAVILLFQDQQTTIIIYHIEVKLVSKKEYLNIYKQKQKLAQSEWEYWPIKRLRVSFCVIWLLDHVFSNFVYHYVSNWKVIFCIKNHQMYIIYYLNDGLFCLNCLHDFFCIFILEKKKDLKKKEKKKIF